MNRYHYNIVGSNRNHRRLFINGTSAISGIVGTSPTMGLNDDAAVISKSRSNKVLLSPLVRPTASPNVKMRIRTNKEM